MIHRTTHEKVPEGRTRAREREREREERERKKERKKERKVIGKIVRRSVEKVKNRGSKTTIAKKSSIGRSFLSLIHISEPTRPY